MTPENACSAAIAMMEFQITGASPVIFSRIAKHNQAREGARNITVINRHLTVFLTVADRR
jgi:hypothetical protein